MVRLRCRVYWSSTSLTVRVPSGATTGSLVVTVLGAATSGSSFHCDDCVVRTISGTVTRVTGGSAISGATVEARLAGVLTSSATTAANGTYSIASLSPATYDLRVLASGFSSEVRSTPVSSNATSTVNVAMSQPGSISGTITQSNGTTAIAGGGGHALSGSRHEGDDEHEWFWCVLGHQPGSRRVHGSSGLGGLPHEQQGQPLRKTPIPCRNLSLDTAVVGLGELCLRRTRSAGLGRRCIG